MSAAFDRPLVSPVLVGRQAQLALLDGVIEQVIAGGGQTLLISGEAGIGKSRLASDVPARVAARQAAHLPDRSARPVIVLKGQCFENDRSHPYALWRDLLQTLLLDGSPAEPDRLVGTTGPILARLVPRLAQPTPPAPEADEARRQVVQALTDCVLFQAMPGGRTRTGALVVLVVEDLHWSDAASLEVLLALTRRLAAQPILLVMTYRHDELYSTLDEFLAALDRQRLAVEYRLPRLTRSEVETLVRRLVPSPRPAQVAFLDTLFGLTEGNPFFIEECLRSLLAAGETVPSRGSDGWSPQTHLQIPRTVQAAVQRRLRQLSPAARDLLTVAATVGQRVDFALLQSLTEYDEAMLVRLVHELIAAQLLVEETADRFVFRHALTRLAVASQLLTRERQVLHRRVIAVLESRATLSADDYLALAYHAEAATDWQRTVRYSRLAGEQARQLFALPAAVTQFSRAIAAAEQVAAPALGELLFARGQVFGLLGDADAARSDLHRALTLAGRSGDRRGQWQCQLALGISWTSQDYNVAGAHLDQALALAHELADSAILAQTLNQIGNLQANREQIAVAISRHEEALALFQAAGDDRGAATTLELLGITAYIADEPIRAQAWYSQAIALLRRLQERPGLAIALAAHSMSGASYVFQPVACRPAPLAECLAASTEAIELTRQLGWRPGEANALLYSALGLGARGQYVAAIEQASLARTIAGEIEHGNWLATAEWTLGALYLDLLSPERALPHLEQGHDRALALGSPFQIGCATAFLARALIAQGDLQRATRLLVSTLSTTGVTTSLPQRLLLVTRGELLLASGQPTKALTLFESLLAQTALTPATTQTTAVAPTLRLWHGQTLQALGRPDEAEHSLQAAVSDAEAQATPPLHWRALVQLARLWRHQGRRGAAVTVTAAAQAIIYALAEGLPTEMATTFRQRALAQLPPLPAESPRRAAQRAFDGLTERERQVAALIAQGHSNRQIAAQLSLSYRTIEVHISNIMGKLGVSNRAQIAAWAARRHLTDTP